jgi:hypothetical protein
VVQLVRLLFLLYEFLLPHTKKAILGIGWVLRYLALGRGRTVWVATTSSLQHQRHSGWSLALGHCYRSALELKTSPHAALLLTLGLLPWYLGKYHDPRAELISDHGTCHGTTVLPAPRAGT